MKKIIKFNRINDVKLLFMQTNYVYSRSCLELIDQFLLYYVVKIRLLCLRRLWRKDFSMFFFPKMFCFTMFHSGYKFIYISLVFLPLVCHLRHWYGFKRSRSYFNLNQSQCKYFMFPSLKYESVHIQLIQFKTVLENITLSNSNNTFRSQDVGLYL